MTGEFALQEKSIASEGSRRRNLGPRNTNRIRRTQGVRLLNKPKPDSCTEPADVNAAGVEGKGACLTPGGLTGGKERAKEQADPGEGQRRRAARSNSEP